MYVMKEMNEMQERGYQVCKRLFAQYIKYYKKDLEQHNIFFKELADDFLKQYKGACDVYEDVFNEEFTLKYEDRKKILGTSDFENYNDEDYNVVLSD